MNTPRRVFVLVISALLTLGTNLFAAENPSAGPHPRAVITPSQPDDQFEIRALMVQASDATMEKFTREAVAASALSPELAQILCATSKAPDPQIFGGLTRSLDPASAKQLITAIDNARGIDLLSAPRLTAKSKVKASMAITREFRYATSYQPDPKSPDKLIAGDFETRDVGVKISVTPSLTPSDAIDLSCFVEITNFLGVRRGDSEEIFPLTGNPDFTRSPVNKNDFIQPVFATRSIDTKVFLNSGMTAVLRIVDMAQNNPAGPKTRQPVQDPVLVLITVTLLNPLTK